MHELFRRGAAPYPFQKRPDILPLASHCDLIAQIFFFSFHAMQSFVVRRSEDDDDEMEPKQVPSCMILTIHITHARTNAGQGGPPVHLQTGPVATPSMVPLCDVCIYMRVYVSTYVHTYMNSCMHACIHT